MSIHRPRPAGSPAYAPLSLAFTVWGLGAALYFVGFFHRVAPAVLTRELAEEFALSATALGNLSAFYFYSYVAIQIPTGVLADRYGPRRILTAGAVLATAGGLLFALAHSLPLVALGRLLIGASVGVAFVAMLKLSTHWFEPSRFASVAGLALGTGLVGAVSAGAPLRWLADAFGWRGVMLVVAAATALLAAAVWLVVRDDPAERGYKSFVHGREPGAASHTMLGGLARVLKSRNVWLMLLVNGGVTGPVLTFGGLWGVPFLATHYHLSTAAAASFCSLLLISWGIGGPLMGALSDRMKKRKPLYLAGAAVATLGWTIVLMVENLPLLLLGVLLAMIGLASGLIMIGYAYAKESAPAALAGTTGGVTNMGNMIGGMLMQPAVGWVLDRTWDGTVVNGAPAYAFSAYRMAFSLMLAWVAATIVLAALTRETHCRQQT
jgi:sugar phosphate permease